MNPSTAPVTTLGRRAVVARMLRDRGDALVVTSLGNPTFDVAAAGDCAQNFYLWGAMGGAVMVGLGLALAQPGKRVLVFVGDGEMMMGLGSLATTAAEQVTNLAVVVIDNEHYAETGMQAAHSGRGVDLPAVAAAVGFAHCRMVRTADELESAVAAVLKDRGPVLVNVKVGTDPVPTSLPPRDGPYLRSRFRTALLGVDAHA
jgi:thiamine pyrophosphate-dependent acetolactate synthase large subunit-like protein